MPWTWGDSLQPGAYRADLRPSPARSKSLWPSPLDSTRLPGWVPSTGDPAPSLKSIWATGFDAVLQMTDSMLDAWFRGNSGPIETLRAFPEERGTEFEAALQSFVDSEDAVAPRFPPGNDVERVPVELIPTGWRFSLTPRRTTLLIGTPGRAIQSWNVAVTLVAEETERSWASRVRTDQLPAFVRSHGLDLAAPPVRLDLDLGRWVAQVEGPISVDADESTALAHCVINYAESDIRTVGEALASVPSIDREVQTVVSEVLRALGSHRQLSPTAAFAPRGAGLGGHVLHASTAVIPGNVAGQEVLSLFVELGGESRWPDPTELGAFVGSEDFAYYCGERMSTASVTAAWSQADRWDDTSFTTDYFPMPLEIDGQPAVAECRMDIDLTDYLGSGVSMTTSGSAAFRVDLGQTLTLRQIRYEGRSVPVSEDWREPTQAGLVVECFPFDRSAPSPGTSAGRSVQNVCERLISHVFVPFQSQTLAQQVSTQMLASLSCVLSKGKYR